MSWSGSREATTEARSSRGTSALGAELKCGSILFASDQRQGVGCDYADAEQDSGADQDHYDSEGQDVGPERADEVSHDFAVVDQDVEEEQCGGHSENSDHGRPRQPALGQH